VRATRLCTPAATMGQMLSAPVTDKHTSSGENGRLKYGASAMQGWRVSTSATAEAPREVGASSWRRVLTGRVAAVPCGARAPAMEDAHTTELEVAGHKDVAFFGVFDGHGGTAPLGRAPHNSRLAARWRV